MTGRYPLHLFCALLVLFFSHLLVPSSGAAADFSVDIKANGSDGPLEISPTQRLEVTVQTAGEEVFSQYADWWLLVDTKLIHINPGFYYYDMTRGWVWASEGLDGLLPSYQGLLFHLPPTTVLSLMGLPPGVYTFYFGVDATMDGVISYESLVYDYVQVTVHEAP